MTAQDLTQGEDARGDFAFFIEVRHFLDNGARLDDEAKEALGSGLHFFRMIIDGEQVHQHGWIEDGEIIQWG